MRLLPTPAAVVFACVWAWSVQPWYYLDVTLNMSPISPPIPRMEALETARARFFPPAGQVSPHCFSLRASPRLVVII